MHTLYAFTGMMMCKILVRVSDVLHQVKYANKVKTNFPVRKLCQWETQTTAAAEIHSPFFLLSVFVLISFVFRATFSQTSLLHSGPLLRFMRRFIFAVRRSPVVRV